MRDEREGRRRRGEGRGRQGKIIIPLQEMVFFFPINIGSFRDLLNSNNFIQKIRMQ